MREIRMNDIEVSARPSFRLPEDMVFSLPSELRTSVSPPWTPRSIMYLTRIVTLLNVAGDSSSFISLRSGGVQIWEIEMAGGALQKEDEVEIEIVPLDDILTVSVDSVGLGAPSGLSVILWFA